MHALIVDDHILIRDALKGVLGTFENVTQIDDVATASEAEHRLSEGLSVDLILLDLALPDKDGLTLLKSIRAAYPATSVVVLSGTEDPRDMVSSLEAGAAGFIPKSATKEVMQAALTLVFSGGIYVPHEILKRPASGARPMQKPSIETKPAARSLGLTDRQIEVLQLMLQGMSNKAICRTLDIAEATVKNHVTAILRALNVSNRTEAVVAAASLGLSSNR
ncbi:MAG: response regulator transcription factor [Paracoccaceae bacterium]